MEDWPKDGKTVNFREMTEPVVDAIRFAYRLERQNDGQDIPWHGLALGKGETVCGPQPDEKLNAENLRYDDEDQGRDALTVLVGLAVQLGIEQGRRMTKAGRQTGVDLMRLSIETLAETFDSMFPCEAKDERELPSSPPG